MSCNEYLEVDVNDVHGTDRTKAYSQLKKVENTEIVDMDATDK